MTNVLRQDEEWTLRSKFYPQESDYSYLSTIYVIPAEITAYYASNNGDCVRVESSFHRTMCMFYDAIHMVSEKIMPTPLSHSLRVTLPEHSTDGDYDLDIYFRYTGIDITARNLLERRDSKMYAHIALNGDVTVRNSLYREQHEEEDDRQNHSDDVLQDRRIERLRDILQLWKKRARTAFLCCGWKIMDKYLLTFRREKKYVSKICFERWKRRCWQRFAKLTHKKMMAHVLLELTLHPPTKVYPGGIDFLACKSRFERSARRNENMNTDPS